MHATSVAVIRGGPSDEYAVSLKTGAGVLEVLKNEPIKLKDIVISRQGEWLVNGFVQTSDQALVDVDVVFIALHGSYGEDGTLQRLLDRKGIAYTGSNAYASAIALNKAVTKDHLKDSGIKLPRHLKVSQSSAADHYQTANSISQLFGPEYFIKPVSGGSSLHTRHASNVTELAKALQDLLAVQPELLVEERICGREATVGIIESFRGQKHYLMPVVEIVPPASTSFFSAEVKYTGETDEICPGRFSRQERDALQEAALAVHQQLDLRHYSRSDFIVANDGVYFLEVNTLPGLTGESLLPKAALAVGSSYRELVQHLLYLAAR